MSRAITFEPLASGSSSASVDRLFVCADVSTDAEEDQGLFHDVSTLRKRSYFQSVETDVSLGCCALLAKSTCAQMVSIGALRSTLIMWIIAGDHLSPAFFV